MNKWWVFTFGCGQKHAGHYVRIFGTYEGARKLMFDKYGAEWAFQYSEEEYKESIKEFPVYFREKFLNEYVTVETDSLT